MPGPLGIPAGTCRDYKNGDRDRDGTGTSFLENLEPLVGTIRSVSGRDQERFHLGKPNKGKPGCDVRCSPAEEAG